MEARSALDQASVCHGQWRLSSAAAQSGSRSTEHQRPGCAANRAAREAYHAILSFWFSPAGGSIRSNRAEGTSRSVNELLKLAARSAPLTAGAVAGAEAAAAA